jgi:hypothetical protein
MGQLKEYDPTNVIISWDGVTLNEGIAEGTFVTIARTTRTFTHNTGGDGGTTRVKGNDRTGTATITLRMGSATNQVLAQKALDEELDPPVPHVAPLLIKDFDGVTLHSDSEAHLDGPANDEFATTEGNREWVLLCPNLRMFSGGNKDAASA